MDVARVLNVCGLADEVQVFAFELAAPVFEPLRAKGLKRDYEIYMTNHVNGVLIPHLARDDRVKPLLLHNKAFGQLRACLERKRPRMFAGGADELESKYAHLGLFPPKVVLAPPYQCGSTCVVCDKGTVQPHTNRPSNPTLASSKGLTVRGALCFALLCSSCQSSFFPSHAVERRVTAGMDTEQMVFYPDARLSPHFHCSQRLVVSRELLEHMDELI